MLPEGQQLRHYRVLRFLKSGGMGEVYLAEDTLLQRPVAIKVIHADPHQYAETDAVKEATRLFLREAQAIAQLDQDNILPVFESGEEYVHGIKLMYMVMPYRHAGSLQDWLRTHLGQELLPLPAIERAMRQAASALQHAHDRQIIHQDVKPANFLVHGETEYPNRLKLQLADFGVAKFMMKTSESQVIRGTPTYMAPEQWDGHPIPATDQYALAVMVYELLAGRSPFVGSGFQNMWYQHCHVQPNPPSTINPRLPKELDDVILRALAKKPEDRYSSVSAFAQAFTQAVVNSGDIYQAVTINMSEARTGTSRVLTLPTGRQVTVAIPAGAYHGQVMRLSGYGRPTTYNGPVGALIVKIFLAAEETVAPTIATTIQQRVPTPVSNMNVVGPAPPRLSPRKYRIIGGIITIMLILGLITFVLFRTIPFNFGIIGNTSSNISKTSFTKQLPQQSLPITANVTQLQIYNRLGNISIMVDPTTSQGMLTGVMKVQASNSSDAAKEFGRIAVDVKPGNDPSVLTVNAMVPNTSGALLAGSGDSVDLAIVLPSSVNTLPPFTLNADVAATGDIAVQNFNGVLALTDNTGNITVQHGLLAAGSCLQTNNGNITLGGGSILDLIYASQLIPCTTNTTQNPHPWFSIKSGKGNVDITLGTESTNLILDANTNNGKINNDFGLNVQQNPDGSATYHGPLIPGSSSTASLVLAVSTGNITLHKAA